MSQQNGHSVQHLTRLPTGAAAAGAHNSNNTRPSATTSNNMNHSNSTSQSAASWAPPNAGGHQHAPGTPSGADFENKMTTSPASSSPQSSSQSGTTLKEHDLLGMSEVSSSSSRMDKAPQSRFHEERRDQNEELLNLNLNLGATELRLGPQETRRKLDDGYPYQRSAPLGSEQGSGPANDNGNFLGGLDGSSITKTEQVVAPDMCSSNAEQNAVGNSDQHQPMDRGFGYSSLIGSERGTPTADAAEGSACRPLIESESLQKWHGTDRRTVSSSEGGLRLGFTLSQPKRPAERSYQEMPPEGKHVVSEDNKTWQERNQHTAIEDTSLAAADKAQERQQQQMIPERVPQEQGAEKKPENEQRLKHDGFLPEKRTLPEGKALPALQPPEPRFLQDISQSERSPRIENYAKKIWQSPQGMMRPNQFSPSDYQNHQQLSHSGQQQEEAARNGGRVGYAPPKPGVTGAKRPFETMDARNFGEPRNGLPNYSLIVSPSEGDAATKSKVQTPVYPSWGSNPAHPWQLLQHPGSSFGPFPSQAPGRNTTLPAVSKPTTEAAGGGADATQKAWEAHMKSIQEPSLGQKVPNSSDSNASTPQASTPTTEAGAQPRAAASPPQPPAHAVGWPPLRSFRKSTIAAQPRPTPVEVQPRPAPPPAPAAPPAAATGSQPNSWFVKVKMDGVSIGRKVDLKTNCSYEKLSLVLEEMFRGFVNGQQSGQARDNQLPSDKRNFLRGSDYVLTYEDRDGDLMLVGDVPWAMFIDTVKRLRIMKGSEAIGAIGLGSRGAEKVSKTEVPV